MKKKLLILTSSLAIASFCQISHGAALLIDAFGGVNPTTRANWSNAGVVEDLTGAAGGTFTFNSGTFNITAPLARTVTGVTGLFNSPTFAGNTMLNNYWFTNGGGVSTVTITGLQTGGVANTLTSALGDMAGSTFTIAANQQYRLYLFGAGNANGQNTTFTFNAEAKTTNPLIVGTAANANHFVTYDFVTPSSLTGFTIPFSYQNTTGTAAFNGLALVAIPEPSSSAMILGAVAFAGLTRRRRNA
jgi:PEP-CTERM motif